MSDLRLHAMAGFALLGGPVLFYRGFRHLRTRRLIENTPTAKIRSMAMGMVEVNGSVQARSQILAPFSGKECVYWQVEVATRQNRRGGWTTVHRNGSGNPFFLEDDTGVAMVYPSGADCRLNFGVEEECLGISLPEVYSDYLRQHCGWAAATWRLGGMRFRERTLEPGQQVYILGSAMPKPQVLTVSDGEALEATGTEDWGARHIRPIQDRVSAVIRRGVNEPTFIISQQKESQLTFMLGLQSTLELVGGPVLTLGGLAYWLDVMRRMGQ